MMPCNLYNNPYINPALMPLLLTTAAKLKKKWFDLTNEVRSHIPPSQFDHIKSYIILEKVSMIS